jgi:peptidoglycan/LPS O-acetylase OafA/YrhL
MFYALLFPGLLGAVLSARSRKRRMRSVLALLALLAVLTLWLPACGGGSSTPHNPGTPVGQSNVTVTATGSGITHTVSVTLNVQ